MLTWLTVSASALTLAPPSLVQGEPASLVATGATSGRAVYFAGGASAGLGPCIGVGQCLGIVTPTILGWAVADATGRAELQLTVPAGVAVGDYLFQAVQANPSALSAVVQAPVLWDANDFWVRNAATAHDARYLRSAFRVDVTYVPNGGLTFDHMTNAAILILSETGVVQLPVLETLNNFQANPATFPYTIDVTADRWSALEVQGQYEPSLHIAGVANGEFSFRNLNLSIFQVDVVDSASVAVHLGPSSEVYRLTSSDSSVSIDGPTSVVELRAFGTGLLPYMPDVQYVFDTLYLYNNTTFAVLPPVSASFPSLRSVGKLWIQQNPSLTDVSAWQGLQVDQCGLDQSAVSVRDNPLLPDCNAQALFDSTCTSPLLITDACEGNMPDQCSLGLGICGL